MAARSAISPCTPLRARLRSIWVSYTVRPANSRTPTTLMPRVRAVPPMNRLTIMATNNPSTANMKNRPKPLRSFLMVNPAMVMAPKVPAAVAKAAVTACRSYTISRLLKVRPVMAA